ncbi:hypothetical protein BKP64_05790 [Marinobacter salinus]|uniref:Integrase n=1 Tax=Marinobacter salinus TaxID=1874317 RepID=A0A1D9GJA0_9GAMM|nr:site-specific integrase [Marinobacter salinus]AOY87722.1 hypothetical protein BKP64_05790 [Marinobacter salinus]
MSKTGQARDLLNSQSELEADLNECRILFRVAMLFDHEQEVGELCPESSGSGQRSFKLKEILALPAAYTKGADALKRSKSTYQRRRISFSVHDFHQLVQRIDTMAKAGAQEHFALMQRHWAGIERASSHSGRRTLMTNIIHEQKKSVKVAQKIAGHVSPSTTLIYEEPPEESLKEALQDAGYKYVG